MSPFLEHLDDCEKLSVIDVVVSLCWGEGGRVIGTGVEVSIHILLHQYSSYCSEGSVHHDKEGLRGVWHLDYRGRKEYFLQFDECFVLFLPHRKATPFLVRSWSGHARAEQLGGKLLGEVAKSNE